MNLLFRRIVASFIDYGIIATYAILLFGSVLTIFSFQNQELHFGPVIGQVIGFVTLTLPVFLYSYLLERSNWKGTVGKRVLGLSVLSEQGTSFNNILIRNILKYLPWELAHTGVHWVVYYSSNDIEAPIWVWAVLILPQVISIAYFFSILLSRGQSSIYDSISKTMFCFDKVPSINE